MGAQVENDVSDGHRCSVDASESQDRLASRHLVDSVFFSRTMIYHPVQKRVLLVHILTLRSLLNGINVLVYQGAKDSLGGRQVLLDAVARRYQVRNDWMSPRWETAEGESSSKYIERKFDR